MPNPHNPSEDKHDDYDERERAMKKNEWLVEIDSYSQLGLAIGSFNNKIGAESFTGTAEMKVEGGVRILEILLCFDEAELRRCSDCKQERIINIAESTCNLCGNRVCGLCWKRHERKHWRPPQPVEERVPF